VKEGGREGADVLSLLSPPLPITLTFKNVSYSVSAPNALRKQRKGGRKGGRKGRRTGTGWPWKHLQGEKQQQPQNKDEEEGKEEGPAEDEVEVEDEEGMEAPKEDNKRITLLSNVTGYVKAGELFALMGASGAGKTTLLDVLAGRKTGHGSISGTILHNGLVLPPSLRPSLTAYVDQNSSEVHSPYMTPKEILSFSAHLRLPRSSPSLPPSLRPALVASVLSLLELDSIKDSIVGPPGSGLSFEVCAPPACLPACLPPSLPTYLPPSFPPLLAS